MSVWLPAGSNLRRAGEETPPAGGAVIFLDRDGVVVVEAHYLSDPEQAALIPGAAEAMCRARRHGFRLVGLSNQSGIGRGRFTNEDFAAVQTRIDELLAGAGAAFDALFYCPHRPGDSCSCRKPAPGLLAEARGYLDWDNHLSWLVGDKVSDLDLARAAGLGAVLVQTGYGRQTAAELAGGATVHVVPDLAAAVDFICGADH